MLSRPPYDAVIFIGSSATDEEEHVTNYATIFEIGVGFVRSGHLHANKEFIWNIGEVMAFYTSSASTLGAVFYLDQVNDTVDPSFRNILHHWGLSLRCLAIE